MAEPEPMSSRYRYCERCGRVGLIAEMAQKKDPRTGHLRWVHPWDCYRPPPPRREPEL